MMIYCYTDSIVFASDSKSNFTITEKLDYSFAKKEVWKSQNKQDKIKSCQIPLDVAERMTTETLLDSILSNPLMVDLFAYDTYEAGYNVVKNEIDAFKVLLERKDLYNVLVEKYSKCCKGVSDDDIMNSMYLAVIMAQPDVVNNTDSEMILTFHNILETKDRHIFVSSAEENIDTTNEFESLMTSYSSRGNSILIVMHT